MTETKFIEDLFYRRLRVQRAVREAGCDGILLSSDVNIFYMTGVVFNGWYYLPTDDEPLLFVRRPQGVAGERIFQVRKPEQITEIFETEGITFPSKLLMETDVVPYSEFVRTMAALRLEPSAVANASTLMRNLRMLKTEWEIAQLRISAAAHARVYAQIADCYREGMLDVQFQAEIERLMRLNGSIGVFRVFGSNMSIFMGSVLTGDNAQTPSPFDFALGGGGLTPSCPIGANGTPLREGQAVMVDMVGNYTDYLTDMTRVFAVGKLPDLAYRAHQASIDINNAIAVSARPGVACAELYNIALAIVKDAGLSDFFMGTKQQAKFVGHGTGLEINEPPVLTPRSAETLEPNMVFALEPKFVIPAVGAVGIENTFLVNDAGVEKLTVFPEEIVELN